MWKKGLLLSLLVHVSRLWLYPVPTCSGIRMKTKQNKTRGSRQWPWSSLHIVDWLTGRHFGPSCLAGMWTDQRRALRACINWRRNRLQWQWGVLGANRPDPSSTVRRLFGISEELGHSAPWQNQHLVASHSEGKLVNAGYRRDDNQRGQLDEETFVSLLPSNPIPLR